MRVAVTPNVVLCAFTASTTPCGVRPLVSVLLTTIGWDFVASVEPGGLTRVSVMVSELDCVARAVDALA